MLCFFKGQLLTSVSWIVIAVSIDHGGMPVVNDSAISSAPLPPVDPLLPQLATRVVVVQTSGRRVIGVMFPSRVKDWSSLAPSSSSVRDSA